MITTQGLNSLEDIVCVDNIDVIYFGAYDLSQALGHPGNTKHEELVAAIKQGVDLVNKHGKYEYSTIITIVEIPFQNHMRI